MEHTISDEASYFSSRVNSCLAARRILERVNWTRQTSLLLRRPYSPTVLSSESLGTVSFAHLWLET